MVMGKYQDAILRYEIVTLKNNVECDVEKVKLKISGPFKMKELVTNKGENELTFSLAGLESKQLLIVLNTEIFSSGPNAFYEGNISCSANLRVQKPLRLKVFVFVPKINLQQTQITLFTGGDEGGTYIELINSGKIPAIYKWKKVKEELRYISQEDDVWEVASMILSDLFDIIEQEIISPESELETNMIRHYQNNKYAQKELLNDHLNVKEILYEIIQNLDLSGKCYKMSCQTPVKITDSFEKAENFHRYHKSYGNTPENELAKLITARDKIEKSKTIGLPNIKSGAFYTLGDILDQLKLNDSCDISSMSSCETGEVKNTVYFFEMCGQLLENQKTVCALHIPPIRKGYEVRSVFELDVAGGESQQLETVFVNLDKAITLNKSCIYLGVKPWYERYRTTCCIANATNYQLSVKLQTNSNISNHKLPKIALGFCNIMDNKMLQLPPLQNTTIGFEGIVGFNEDFKRRINIIVNESTENALELYGHGRMPMLAVVKPFLPVFDQQLDEICEEYYLLQKIYYFENFKTFTEQEEDYYCSMSEEENDMQEVQSLSSIDASMQSDITQDGSKISGVSGLGSKRDKNFFKLLTTYIFVNQNEDLPNYEVLEHLLQTEKFHSCLRSSPEKCALLNSLYQDYMANFKTYNEQVPINLKHFNVQSLPYNLKAHILDMGRIYLNQFRKIMITLDFYGPGKLIAAASTTVQIPGLMIDFRAAENCENNNFTYYRTDDITNYCDKPYRNMNERILDKEINPKFRHAHSYDFNKQQQHQRNKIATCADIKCLKKYYDSLNKSIYLERKHNFTYCKIAGNKKSFKATQQINISLLFCPQKAYFEHNQCLEDFLFIDLHLGTTLPLLLRALIIDPKRMDNL